MALWGLGTASGISLESFREFRAPSMSAFVFIRINNLVENILQEAEKERSAVISRERYFRFYDNIREMLEIDPEIRDILHLILPFEQIYIDKISGGSTTVNVSEIQCAKREKDKYYEDTNEYREFLGEI